MRVAWLLGTCHPSLMHSWLSETSLLLRFASILVLLGGSAACEAPAHVPASSPPSVCPSCGPQAGGESSDFGGTPTECGWVAKRAPIETAEAEALGYDVSQMRARVERELDAPLRWQTRPLEQGEPAQGYEPETRVRGRVVMSTALEHWRPAPEYCDGTTCVREAVMIDQATCPHFLSAGITVTLETLDGAVMATAEGEATQWASGFEAMIGDEADDHPIGHAYANLRDVTGSLVLRFPEEATDDDAGANARQPGHPYAGTLTVELDFMADETHGVLWPSVWWEATNERGATELRDYEPVHGTWPAD